MTTPRGGELEQRRGHLRSQSPTARDVVPQPLRSRAWRLPQPLDRCSRGRAGCGGAEGSLGAGGGGALGAAHGLYLGGLGRAAAGGAAAGGAALAGAGLESTGSDGAGGW